MIETGCKICASTTEPFGKVDFNRSCEEARGLVLPPSGELVSYERCTSCGLIFTRDFDGWSHAEFQRRIYNDGYAQVDPDSEIVRPDSNAALLIDAFRANAGKLSVLDYGGGSGRLAERLRQAGFGSAVTYDPFHPAHAEHPSGTYNLVTSFETFEHLPDPVAGARDVASLLAEDGLIFIATLAQPADIEQQGVGWWYIGPRNGHITLFSKRALQVLWGDLGFTYLCAGDNLHIAFRKVPAFARHLLGPHA